MARAAQPCAAAVHWFGFPSACRWPLGRLPASDSSDTAVAVAPSAETRGLPAASPPTRGCSCGCFLVRTRCGRMWPPPPRAARPSYSALKSGVAVWTQSAGRGGQPAVGLSLGGMEMGFVVTWQWRRGLPGLSLSEATGSSGLRRARAAHPSIVVGLSVHHHHEHAPMGNGYRDTLSHLFDRVADRRCNPDP